ncbi:MAG: hypothetical protein HOO19_13525 [Rhodospirillaceae bacterium]|mgnify:CR=1|jgi:branched-chain amino acid aminotransferase|nr:hypothetical protein [Rhodospirillaceae bacterium]MBT3883840.1 hypothetical protein [Rhodospirillaceae bacterium]MBT4117811.1 hypothetical protein [Rhodospirillaceae bacterium]MBT4672939.1 hypothetical protein [Rhodospirillaceae bacterium]MBT4720375.1 hypothetical protein [Rhodospirillaceae bacterium]
MVIPKPQPGGKTRTYVDVTECKVDYAEPTDADKLFSTANYSKIMPCIRLDKRDLQPGPMFERARA